MALRQGNTAAAVSAWKRALELGIADADLCFRYAALADERGLPARDALLRAIALRPEFDDARFKLALLEKNSGHAAEAIVQLQAMRKAGDLRAFAYWSAIADAYLDLNRRAEPELDAVAEERWCQARVGDDNTIRPGPNPVAFFIGPRISF